MKIVCVSIVVLALVCQALSWGTDGHKIVAQIAYDLLSTSAQSSLKSDLQGKTLADIAPWADSYRTTPQGKWSSSCHYVNFPRDATEFEWSYCPNYCVIRSINNYTSILEKDSNSICTDYEDICSLAMLVHFVGDIHQPLHCGYADDSGGNSVQVTFFGKSYNLHSLWDSGILDKWNSNWQAATQDLEAMMSADPSLVAKYSKSKDPIDWADESFDDVKTVVYDFGTNAKVPALGEEYYNMTLPVVQQRLIAGGVRLANLLNDLY